MGTAVSSETVQEPKAQKKGYFYPVLVPGEPDADMLFFKTDKTALNIQRGGFCWVCSIGHGYGQ